MYYLLYHSTLVLNGGQSFENTCELCWVSGITKKWHLIRGLNMSLTIRFVTGCKCDLEQSAILLFDYLHSPLSSFSLERCVLILLYMPGCKT